MFIQPRPEDEDPVDPRAILREGTVLAVDLDAGTVEVETGEVRSAPIRFSTGRAGDTRIWSPPSVGEQVLLLCPEGDLERAICIGAIPQDSFPPAGNSLTELILFADGAQLSYDPEGHHLELALPDNATLALRSTGGVSIDVGSAELAITGNVTIDGDLEITGAIRADGDVTGAGVSLENHLHGEVASGQSQSGPPA
jgi:phage baseplate assembly protein V